MIEWGQRLGTSPPSRSKPLTEEDVIIGQSEIAK